MKLILILILISVVSMPYTRFFIGESSGSYEIGFIAGIELHDNSIETQCTLIDIKPIDNGFTHNYVKYDLKLSTDLIEYKHYCIHNIDTRGIVKTYDSIGIKYTVRNTYD
jgi:hypothetical protein